MDPIPVFDAHCDTAWRMCRQDNTEDHLARSTGQVDLARASSFAPYGQFFALYSNPARPGPAMWSRYLAMVSRMYKELDANREQVVLCRTAQQAETAARQGRAAAFLSVEGAELLDCAVDKLDIAFEHGVRAVNLTWNHANALCGSHCDRPEQGLTARGVEFVRHMKRLGMLVDVSHLSDPGVWDVLEVVGGPIMASHSNARSVFFHTRNLTDEQITAIIKGRGVIGLNLYAGFVGPGPCKMDALRAHLDHILDLGGEDCLALGGDWDGAWPMVEGFEDISNWRLLYEELLVHNCPEALIQKIFYNNMMRIVKEVCST